jgi:hypothetical protein
LIDFCSRNVVVGDHVVRIWGLVGPSAERKALLARAESVLGVVRVCDEMISAISRIRAPRPSEGGDKW